jgi:hypothetical protein
MPARQSDLLRHDAAGGQWLAVACRGCLSIDPSLVSGLENSLLFLLVMAPLKLADKNKFPGPDTSSAHLLVC